MSKEPFDISLGLTEAARDKAIILTLLACRINDRLLKNLYRNLSGRTPENMDELHHRFVREELAWVFRTLGDSGELNVSDLNQCLDPIAPNPER